MKKNALLKTSVCLLALLSLAACGSSGPVPKGVKVGKPYSIAGKTYYPEYDPTYDETGIASWYGPGFHGKSTANGEKFNTHDLTAAHPTLPMPSMVRVTNLENGKAIVARINDRGPFAAGRIIDLSKASAQKLGVTGLAKVRVQYMAEESQQYIEAVNEGRRIDMLAFNEQMEASKKANILAATAPSDQSFIIASEQNVTRPGDTVSGAAPIVSVAGADLPAPKASKRSRGLLVRDAMADEGSPEPTQQRGGPVILTSPTIVPDDSENMVIVKEMTPAGKKAPKLGGKGSYMVQVGSFSQETNARKMEANIAEITTHVTKVDVGGNQWWRLQAGPFTTNDEATAALDQIRSSGAPDARIIKQ